MILALTMKEYESIIWLNSWTIIQLSLRIKGYCLEHKSDACGVEAIHSESVKWIGEHIPEKQTLGELSDLYTMLSNHTRIQILWAFEYDDLCVCDLAALLNMTISAGSHQLRVLRLAKLVASHRDGKNIYNSLSDDHVKDIPYAWIGSCY